MYTNYECKYSRSENLIRHQRVMETISNNIKQYQTRHAGNKAGVH